MNKNSLLLDINVDGCDDATVTTLTEMMNFIKNKLQGIADKAKTIQCKKDNTVTVFPYAGDKYYTVTSYGEIKSFTWEGFQSEKFLAKMGNVFKTEEDAKFEKDKRIISQKLKVFAANSQCHNTDTDKCYISYDCFSDELSIILCGYNTPLGSIVFPSHKVAEEALNLIGKDTIKKYFFNINTDTKKEEVNKEEKDYYSGDDEYYNWY